MNRLWKETGSDSIQIRSTANSKEKTFLLEYLVKGHRFYFSGPLARIPLAIAYSRRMARNPNLAAYLPSDSNRVVARLKMIQKAYRKLKQE